MPGLSVEQIMALALAARQAWIQAYCPYSGYAVGAAVLAEIPLERRLSTMHGHFTSPDETTQFPPEIFAGCNVENASFGGTICAERAAVCAAVAAGMRPGGLLGIALVGATQGMLIGAGGSNGDGSDSTRVIAATGPVPCGICLQVLAEFALPDCIVITGSPDPAGELGLNRLDELLPRPFKLG